MADLTELQSSLSVKIAGAGASTGIETNWMAVDTFGSAQISLYNSSGSALDTNFGSVSSTTLRVASQIGNATGSADFNAGNSGAQTLRVVIATNQSAIPAAQSGTWSVGRTWSLASGTDSITSIQGTSPWVVSGTVTAAEDKNYGVVGSNTLRTASQIGNATGSADFNAGATGAQTLRTVSNQGVPNTEANAWPVKITDGTNNLSVSPNGDLEVVDGLRNGGVYGNLSLPTANTPVEAKVGASRLTNRKNLTIVAFDNDMFWGYDSSVTTSNGTPLLKGQSIAFEIVPGSTFQVFLVCAANSKNARITESP